ncbi:MAG: ribosome biogenesis GTP-binding protein YihA/YsxC [Betaproteobacteria bacterium]
MAKQALMSLFRSAEFALATYEATGMPQEVGTEVAFAGRSNSGKSSAINAIVGRKGLAHASKSPGRTQTVNFFRLGTRHCLVDLPGYGYAAVPQREIERWDRLISAYISRASLRGVVLVMDIRRPFTGLDLRLLDWIRPYGKTCHILLTKADKLSAHRRAAALADAESVMKRIATPCTVQLFSGKTGLGAETARHIVAAWLGANKKPPVKGE